MSKLYDWDNVLIFTVISAAMMTVSARAVRFAFDIITQLNWYPSNIWFVVIVILVGTFVVFISISGFNAVSEFSGICVLLGFFHVYKWCIGLLPALSLVFLGITLPVSWVQFIDIGDKVSMDECKQQRRTRN
jgi:cytosine permease